MSASSQENNLTSEIIQQAGEARVWIYDNQAQFYRTRSQFCPHKDISADECLDCGMVLESDDSLDGCGA